MRLVDFELYKDLLKEKSGLTLTPDKCYLLDSRLTPVARKWGYPTIESMTLALRGVADPKLVRDIVEAMTTNETFFFRDDRPFQQFRNIVIPYLLKNRKKQKTIRIWSAACSTGQEPYSIAMILDEIFQTHPGWRAEIIATDLAEHVLDYARKGEYSQFEVQRGLTIHTMMKHFTQMGTTWKINDNLKKMVRFEAFNLLEPMDRLGTFDIIFCRNVLIYFDEATKRTVLENLADRLVPDGFLLLGGAETVLGLTQELKIMPGCSGLYVHQDAKHVIEEPPKTQQQAQKK